MKYLAAIASLIFTAYSAAPAANFEVVAIHRHDPNLPATNMKFLPEGAFSISGMTTRNLIWLAWQLPPERVTGGPKWLDSDRYDIQANPLAGVSSSIDAQGPRIQALLADRLQLKLHRETKTLPVYELTIAEGGLKMEEAKGPGAPYHNDKGSLVGWSTFLRDLTLHLGRPVIDKTGLKGVVWYIRLRYTSDNGKPSGIGTGPMDPTQPVFEGGPSIFTAVQEQLGLKLDPGTGPVDMLIIDSIARPSLN